jgi:hypothetical protein
MRLLGAKVPERFCAALTGGILRAELLRDQVLLE